MPLLSIEHVSETHRVEPSPQPILRDVSLTLETGECMAVWGGRASGKTALLELAAGLQPPELGVVRLCGEDLRRRECAGAALLSGEIGWAANAALPVDGLQALDCVALPLIGVSRSPRAARERACEALAAVGMASRAQARCEQLSAREQALTRIAQAIAPGPRLLLADDPAGHLARRERESVMSLLRELAEQRSLAVLVTVSDIACLPHAHRVGALNGGRLFAADATAPVYDNVIELRRYRYAAS